MNVTTGNRSQRTRIWGRKLSSRLLGTGRVYRKSKMKNRIFENKKISRTPLDLGSRLVDLISRYFIISRFILLLKRLKSFILALKRLKSFILAFRSFRSFNKKIAFLSRISPNIAHFLAKIMNRFSNSCNVEVCVQPRASLAKVRNHILNLRA